MHTHAHTNTSTQAHTHRHMSTFCILERNATESMDVFSVGVFYLEKFWVYYWNTLRAVTRCRQQENNSVESCSSHVTLQAAQITARGFPWPCKDDTRYLHEAKGWHQVMSQGSGQSEDREGRRKQGWERTPKANCHRTWVNLWMGEKIISAPQYFKRLIKNAFKCQYTNAKATTQTQKPQHRCKNTKTQKPIGKMEVSVNGCLQWNGLPHIAGLSLYSARTECGGPQSEKGTHLEMLASPMPGLLASYKNWMLLPHKLQEAF